MLLMDVVGMVIFNIIGIEKVLIGGVDMVVVIIIGMIIGIFGGLMCDVICWEVFLVMGEEFYLIVCLFGGLIYVVLFIFEVSYIWCIFGVFVVMVCLRLGVIYFGW